MINLSNDQPDKGAITIRELVESDLESCVQLFFETVHAVNTRDYTDEQVNAWAPATITAADSGCRTILANIAYVAELNGLFVGFGDINKQGYLDRLFVHHGYQRMGIASALVKKLEEQAIKLGIEEITTHASITARPFFESFGFAVFKKQEVDVGGVKMINFVMKKSLK